MKTERSRKDQVDSKRGIFFQLGLVISILGVILFMNFSYSAEEPAIIQDSIEPPIEFSTDITIIENEKAEKKEELKKDLEKQEKYDPNRFEFVEEKKKPTEKKEFVEIDPTMFSIKGETPPEPIEAPIDFQLIEDKPEFKGGIDGLYRYINKNLIYPPKSKR